MDADLSDGARCHSLRVEVAEDPDVSVTVLFDPEHNLDERIIK